MHISQKLRDAAQRCCNSIGPARGDAHKIAIATADALDQLDKRLKAIEKERG
jgi:hypothetical protein